MQRRNEPGVDDLFGRASAALRVGNLAEAEHLYKSVLRAQPHHLGALNLLGILLIQVGRDDDAERSIRTCLGTTFAGRVAGSLLKAVGCRN